MADFYSGWTKSHSQFALWNNWSLVLPVTFLPLELLYLKGLILRSGTWFFSVLWRGKGCIWLWVFSSSCVVGVKPKDVYYWDTPRIFAAFKSSLLPVSSTACSFLCDNHSDWSDMEFQHSLTYHKDTIYSWLSQYCPQQSSYGISLGGCLSRDRDIKILCICTE